MRPRVQIQKLRPDAIVPRYMTARAAGLDLSAAIDGPIEIAVGKRAAIPTGLAIKLPEGYEAQVRPRSGLAREHGVTLVNSPGTIDEDYVGPIIVLLINHGDRPVRIEAGQRIAQLVIAPVVQAELVEVDELPATARGAGGFGSTGR
ncbi:MAG TPA: dUTP diphosphatase [Kofleriaceae bacterium]|nr:dUTP diphosphatase [Kofleriaceae bacterium]